MSDKPATLYGAPMIAVDGVRSDFIAYINVQYYVHMPLYAVRIDGIVRPPYSAHIALPEGI